MYTPDLWLFQASFETGNTSCKAGARSCLHTANSEGQAQDVVDSLQFDNDYRAASIFTARSLNRC